MCSVNWTRTERVSTLTVPSGDRADCRMGELRSRLRSGSAHTARLQSLALITKQDVGNPFISIVWSWARPSHSAAVRSRQDEAPWILRDRWSWTARRGVGEPRSPSVIQLVSPFHRTTTETNEKWESTARFDLPLCNGTRTLAASVPAASWKSQVATY